MQATDPGAPPAPPDALVERLFNATTAAMDLFAVYLGTGSATTGPWPTAARRRAASWRSGPIPPSATPASGWSNRP